eukprot:10755511-Alexandrium_andersonii.AAC.1
MASCRSDRHRSSATPKAALPTPTTINTTGHTKRSTGNTTYMKIEVEGLSLIHISEPTRLALI